MAAWRLSPLEAMALTDEQFNALMIRLMERKDAEREARGDGGGGEREVSDGTALAELGVKVENLEVQRGNQSR